MSFPKTAVISDLHGNLSAAERAVSDARERGVRRFVCLGDVVGYGAQPRETLDVVMPLCGPNARDAEGNPLEEGICLRGNHEDALLTSAEDFNPKARAAIDWTRQEILEGGPPELRDGYWDFIGDLVPSRVDEVAMYAHGSPREPIREYMLPRDIHDQAKMEANFRAMSRDVCFIGHSHIPAVYYEDGRIYQPHGTEGPYELGVGPGRRAIVNVGSIGQPRDGDPRLSYVVFDGQTVHFIRLDYDFKSTAARIRAVEDLPDYLADRLALGR